MDNSSLLQTITVLLALLFIFTNGFHDSSNLVATAITARSLTPEAALLLAAVSTFVGASIGAFFLGAKVAWVLRQDIFSLQPGFTEGRIASALITAISTAIVWDILTWRWGFPSSSFHALIGGLVGAFLSAFGSDSIHWEKISAIFMVMLLSPLVGFLGTFLLTKITFFMGQSATPALARFFKRMQNLALIAQSFGYGTNDAQKGMGLMMLAIGFSLPQDSIHNLKTGLAMFSGYLRIILISALAISLGILMGGWRLIRTLGRGFYPVKAIHGFAAQTTSAAILYFATLFGYPLSSTQVVSASILGAGAAFRPKAIRWALAGDLTLSWLVTIPACALLAALAFKLVQLAL